MPLSVHSGGVLMGKCGQVTEEKCGLNRPDEGISFQYVE